MDIKLLKPNPNNPRSKKGDIADLCESIRKFPQMMRLRPIIYDEGYIVLGGNMRLEALIKLGYTEIPDEWVKAATDLTEAQKKEFIIKDNSSFGEWDWEALKEWDESENELLAEWMFGGTEPEQVDTKAPLTLDDIKNIEDITDGVPDATGTKKVTECTCPKCGFKWIA